MKSILPYQCRMIQYYWLRELRKVIADLAITNDVKAEN